MTDTDLKATVVRLLTRIAPEARGQALAPGVSLRDQLDLDSMDFLNVLIGLHERTGAAIPEADSSKLRTLRGIVAYLAGC